MSRGILDVIAENERTMTPWRHRLGWYLVALFVIYFALFMIPESIWSNISPDVIFSKIYPKFISITLENNIIRKTEFQMSAYALWCMAPIFMLGILVVCLAYVWPSEEFEQFLVRRQNHNLIPICLIVIVLFIWYLLNTTISIVPGPFEWFWKPYQRKLSFFLLFGGMTIALSICSATLVHELRARIHLNRK